MGGSWDDLSIDLSLFLAKHDVKSGFVCAVEADDLTSAWRISELAELASREGFCFLELLLGRSYKGWASEMRLVIGRSRCDVDVRVLSISAEVPVVAYLRNKNKTEVFSELAELLKVGVFEVHMT